ncbi:hypothetical protein SBOR_5070 [Sclerotinia borealis F-4128]|uniref:Uncharacterized protein n=1 Tax=Sclerotinia borealis (strain F-4128) TaxID=1432307 RepID=W9CCN7_SCLBF|nr:hypothetical protein SBOR_5070 [Sclerotinia borealis F-4128]
MPGFHVNWKITDPGFSVVVQCRYTPPVQIIGTTIDVLTLHIGDHPSSRRLSDSSGLMCMTIDTRNTGQYAPQNIPASTFRNIVSSSLVDAGPILTIATRCLKRPLVRSHNDGSE